MAWDVFICIIAIFLKNVIRHFLDRCRKLALIFVQNHGKITEFVEKRRTVFPGNVAVVQKQSLLFIDERNRIP